MMNQLDAIGFFDDKAQEFGSEFSALFQHYGIDKPVTGKAIAEAIVEKGKNFSEFVANILDGGDMNNFSSFDANKFQTTVQTGADTANSIANLVNVFKKDKTQPTQTNKQAPTAQKAPAKFMGMPVPLAIGLGAILFLVILIVIIKKAKK